MTNKPLNASRRTSQILYQISVRGALRKDWKDWFNGMLIATEGPEKGESNTTFTCKVRDQAEMIGIVNWLHEMNMVIEKVNLIPTERFDRKGGKNV